MNKLGFGLLRFPLKDNTPDAYDWELLETLVDRYLALGGRYFDTCYTYLNGASEEAVRRLLSERYPRERFIVAEKLPGYRCQSYEDCRKFYEEEKRRCGLEYFDVFMLHWLNRENYEAAEKYDEFRFLREVKAEGGAKYTGFSYHDSASLLDRILTAHPDVDVVQLQINYLDWESAGVQSRECYEVCVKHGKKVIVMEPVKGGTLASLPEEAEKLLRSMHPDWSMAAWALRFVQSLPEVVVCLSGMNAMAQVEDNMADFEPLREEELSALAAVREIIERNTLVNCTGCRYCVEHCPQSILIPDYFRMLNELYRYPQESWKIRPAYEQLALGHGKASDCLACRSCEEHCPQRIEISEFMKRAAEQLG